MKSKGLIIVLMGLFSLASVIKAAEESTPEDPAETTEPAELPDLNKGQKKAVNKLSEKFDVPEITVLELRESGMGWGEVGHALSLAERSGEPLDEIVALRESGMGWGQIAKKYDLKLGKVKKDVKFAESQGKKFDKASRPNKRIRSQKIKHRHKVKKHGSHSHPKRHPGRRGPKK